MPSRILPNIGLTGYWPLGDDDWKSGMDENLLRLSVLGQLVAETFVAGEPAGVEGKVVLTQNAPQIGIYDNGAWHYVDAKEGWRAWVKSEDALYVFDGDSWEIVTTGESGGGSGLPPGGDPGQVLTKSGGDDGVASWQNLAGKSAYQVALDNGFVGSQAVWLASLHGEDGADSTVAGPAGQGVPVGGATGQVLAKNSNANYDTEWIDQAEGTGLPAGGTAGQILSKSTDEDGDAVWIDPPTGGSGGPGGGSSPHGAHVYWRVFISVIDGGSNTVASTLEYRATPSGANLAFGGTATTNSTLSSYIASYAYDGDDTTLWAATGPTDNWIGYTFLEAVEVSQISFRGQLANPERSPKDFAIQYSDDGSTWTTAWIVTGSTGWSAGETRLFTDPAYAAVDYVEEAPEDGQPYVRYNGTWITLADALAL